MSTFTGYQLLAVEPGSNWREPVVKGTGIRATTLALAVENEGRSPEQVAADFAVPLSAVLEALEYSRAHGSEIDRERLEMDQDLIRRGFMNPDGTWKSISTTT